ncbi:nitroreductase family protein [Oceanibium sediminis]|uniref:nitroreductase family protein n=1 Tax=Oceanibium sediminis TaxID=2026339 RepID=UPI000DD487E9|nr:nitroreductase [Oceanibium sediminis]
MPTPNPDALDFLLTRRSRPAKTLVAPAPDRAALAPILTAGLRVPDHGKLEPWRLVVLEGAALTRLAEVATRRAQKVGMDPDKAAKAAQMFSGAPLIVAVISAPVESEKVPEIEQLYSAGAVCLSLVNAALAAGWGANWLTGWTATDPAFLGEALNLRAPAEVAGYIVIGTETTAPPDRPRPEVEAKVTWVDE